MAGGVPSALTFWEPILELHPKRGVIFAWLKGPEVNVRDFMEHFSGSYKGVRYDSSHPPSKFWPNHASCKTFAPFVSNNILKRVQ